MPEDRWAKVKEFIAEWFEPLGEGDGYSEEEIAAAEARLGIYLPETLKEFYHLIGNRNDIIRNHNRFFSLEELKTPKEEHFNIWKENQGSIYFAFQIKDMNQPDPVVYGLLGGEDIIPELSESKFTEIVPLLLAWEVINAGKFVAIGILDTSLFQTLKSDCNTHDFSMLSDFGILSKDESLIQFSGEEEITISSPDLQSFIRLVESLPDTEWSFISTEDDGTYYFGEEDKEE